MNNPIPASIDLEQNILGLILLDNKYYEEIKDILDSHHFSLPKHVHLYMAMQQVYAMQKKITPLVLFDYLKTNNLIERVGDMAYFVELQSVITKTDDLPTMANTIVKKYQRRVIQQNLLTLNSKLTQDTNSTDDEINNLITEIVKANTFSSSEIFKHISKSAKDVMSALASQPEARIHTGYVALDELLGGLVKKNLVLLAARPGMGKTMLALNMALNMAKNGYKIAFISLEMSEKEIIIRALTHLSQITYKDIFMCNLGTEQYKSLTEWISSLVKLPFFITESTLNIQEIKRHLIKLKKDEKIDVVYIDYLQLISGTKYTDNRNLEIGGITKELKALSKELDVVIVLLSQLNRALESRPDKRPIASDLRDSGSIEQDADQILFIYRDVVYNNEANAHEAELIINKNRNGESHKTIKLSFNGRTMSFENHGESKCQPNKEPEEWTNFGNV